MAGVTPSTMFFLFAGLMLINWLVFVAIARNFVSVSSSLADERYSL